MKAMLENRWGRAFVSSRWSRGAYATMKCLCFCYLGLELALTRGPVPALTPITVGTQTLIRSAAQSLVWATAVFCLVRGLPVFLEGWKYLSAKLPRERVVRNPQGDPA